MRMAYKGTARGAAFMGDAARQMAKRKTQKLMSPEGFEPPTFGSGIRRAAVAPWAPDFPPWDSNPRPQD